MMSASLFMFMMFMVVAAVMPFTVASAATDVDCDIVVAGGSTASLAAAITAAEAAPNLSVCYTEITDWPGGQMTAGGVPAIDFGGSNKNPDNQPASFRSAMDSMPGNPGACTVSTKCYRPNVLVEEWIMPRLMNSTNLKVFLRTVITGTERDSSGKVTSLHAVQRTPKPGTVEWSARLSDELEDWYTETDTAGFTKEALTLNAKVFIEATELGDVLATSNIKFGQGIEVPFENSTTYESGCGQAQTLTFYMELAEGKPTDPYKPPWGGPGWNGTWPSNASYVGEGGSGWHHTWYWRRSYDPGNQSTAAVNVGDITQQNLGNDLDTAYPFLPLPETLSQAKSGWMGGMNKTALRMLEDRAYGWYWFVVNTSIGVDPTFKDRLFLNRTVSGTAHGLSKFPYLRDTRRAYGLDGFRLTHPPLRDNVGDQGTHFNDSVALGDYNDDTHHLRMAACPYPAYMPVNKGEGAKPYFIPLRALLVDNAPNLLVAGKTMSQSFHANSNTRLHPSEWTSGVAAGGTAVLMVRNGWSTADALANIGKVQNYLNSSAVGQPLLWSDLPPNDAADGVVCELGRCFGVDKASANISHHHYNSSCPSNCSGLASYEWLANAAYWTKNTTIGSRIYAKGNTVLKKSTVMSGSLPPSDILSVSTGDPCILVDNHTFAGYWVCVHHTHGK